MFVLVAISRPQSQEELHLFNNANATYSTIHLFSTSSFTNTPGSTRASSGECQPIARCYLHHRYMRLVRNPSYAEDMVSRYVADD